MSNPFKTPRRWAKRQEFMKTSVNEISKAQALGMVAYLMAYFPGHFGFDCSAITCDVHFFCHTFGEVISLEFQLSRFMVDGCSRRTDYLAESDVFCTTYNFPLV